jgi:hypothetical protein
MEITRIVVAVLSVETRESESEVSAVNSSMQTRQER